MEKVKAVLCDGSEQWMTIDVTKENNKVTAYIAKEKVPQEVDYIDFLFMHEAGREGDEGYMVLPNNYLFGFKNHEDEIYELKRNMMPVYGVKNNKRCFVAIVKSMSYDYHTICKRENGIYSVYPRFILDGDGMPEDILIEYYMLPDACDYNDMAAVYREYILSNGICIPISERMKERPELAYAKDAPLIRIRNGWKPCPAEVMEQTPENEPPMHVACDFERVGKIIDEFKKQGIEKAEISLVGWNVRGHDGRWPDILPADWELGGNEKLTEVIKKGQENGYNMTCHTNSTDAYSIASSWDSEKIIRNKDMSISMSNMGWSGGQMYNLCPKPAYELAKELLPAVAELGFKGIHYIDVMSSVFPRKCYHPEHRLNRREGIAYYRKIAELCTELFGGFSSEAGADYACPFIDYALYVDFGDASMYQTSLKDKFIPLWQLVYHGIVLYNPLCDTMNYTIKGEDAKLKLIELGGRPTFYFYSRFVDETKGVSNWMGMNDLVADDEHLSECVAKIKEGCEEYEKLSYLQTCFMLRHEEIEDNIYRITYSDGSKIIINYNDKIYEIVKE